MSYLDQNERLSESHKHFPYLFGIVNSLEVYKGKATGATRALVVHHIDPCQRTIA